MFQFIEKVAIELQPYIKEDPYLRQGIYSGGLEEVCYLQ